MMRLLFAVAVAACAGAAAEGPPPAKELQVNHTGEAVELTRVLVPDYVTIVDFWSESCGACEVVGGMTAVAIARQPGIVVRKIDVGDGDTEVARQYQIGALPHYQVYDRHGKLRFDFVGNDCLKASTVAMQLLHEP